MGETGNEIPWFREAGDHPPGRALSPAGPTDPGRQTRDTGIATECVVQERLSSRAKVLGKFCHQRDVTTGEPED